MLWLTLLVCVVPAVVLPMLARRAGWSDPAVRRVVWTGVAVAVVPLLGQAWLVGQVVAAGPPRGGAPGVAGVDHAVLQWFVEHRSGWATGLAIVLAAVGGPAAMTVLTLAAGAVLGYLGQWPRAVLVAVSAAGGGLLVRGFKEILARHRPPRADQVIHYAGHSLPSGHAVGSIVVLGLLTAVLVRARERPGPGSAALTVTGAVLLVAAIGWCRVYLGAHWLSDVLTGWLLGGAWVALSVTALVLLDRVVERQAPERTPGERAAAP
jgi:undecaprenyl-diphosphatase